jgi:hypothetical protein
MVGPRMIKKTQTPCNGTSFKGEKKVIYKAVWSISSFRRIDMEPTETPHATTERRAD